jgi:hypothetical protein
MIVTCHRCPRQISFPGTWRRRIAMALLFGWSHRGGRFTCAPCSE